VTSLETLLSPGAKQIEKGPRTKQVPHSCHIGCCFVPGPCMLPCLSIPSIQDISISYHTITPVRINNPLGTRSSDRRNNKTHRIDTYPPLTTQNSIRARQDGFLRQPNHLCRPIQQPNLIRFTILRPTSSPCIQSTTPQPVESRPPRPDIPGGSRDVDAFARECVVGIVSSGIDLE